MPNPLKAFWLLSLMIKLRLCSVSWGKGLRGNRVVIKNRGTIRLGQDVCLNSHPDGELYRTGLKAEYGHSEIAIGDRCTLNGTMVYCMNRVVIGDDCMFGPGARIFDNDSHRVCLDPKERMEPPETAPVILEDNVWVGTNALILKGVTVGRNAIVGACSVVTRDVPRDTLVAGNPARVIRPLDTIPIE